MIEKFIANINYLSLPDTVISYHLKNIINHLPRVNKKKELQICYDNVYGGGRGKSIAKVEPFKQEFSNLMRLEGIN